MSGSWAPHQLHHSLALCDTNWKNVVKRKKKRKEERNIEKEKPQIQKKKMKKIGWNPLDQLDKEIDTSESEEICAIAKTKNANHLFSFLSFSTICTILTLKRMD